MYWVKEEKLKLFWTEWKKIIQHIKICGTQLNHAWVRFIAQKIKRIQTNGFSFHLKKLEEKEQTYNKHKKGDNVRVEINERENRKIIEKINYTSSQTDAEKNDKNQMNNIRNARNRFNTNLQLKNVKRKL